MNKISYDCYENGVKKFNTVNYVEKKEWENKGKNFTTTTVFTEQVVEDNEPNDWIKEQIEQQKIRARM